MREDYFMHFTYGPAFASTLEMAEVGPLREDPTSPVQEFSEDDDESSMVE